MILTREDITPQNNLNDVASRFTPHVSAYDFRH